jgi:6-phosphogluconolactonase
MPIEHFHQDRTSLEKALAGHCLALIRQGLLATGDVSILLSGGSTPLPLYHALASAPLPWTHIHPALVDERWVDPGDTASNEAAIKSAFKDNQSALSNFLGMYKPAVTAAEAASTCSDHYRRLPPPVFCLLGMGNDAHTASLFPGAEGLAAAFASMQWCAAIEAIPSAVTGANTTRMTLTPWGILQARHLILLFTGEAKRSVYEQALQQNDPEKLPISYFLHQKARPVEVFWCP